MMSEAEVRPTSGPIAFDSIDSMRSYVKGLLDYYQKEEDRYGDEVGKLIRIVEEKSGSIEGVLKSPKRMWRKVGTLLLDTAEPNAGKVEVMVETLEEFKLKASKTRDALRSFEEIEELLSENKPLTLYLRNGIPERVISG